MIKSFITIAWRNIKKQTVFSLINISGLSAGIAFALLIGAFIWGEYQVNASLPDNDRIYMVQSKWKDPNMGYDFTTFAPLVKALKENYPGLVEDYYHHDGITSIISTGDKHFSEGLQVGDASLLTLFKFPLLYGNAATALNSPTSIAITETKAVKFFGKKDVVGNTLTLSSFSGSKQDFTVTAVLKDPPENTITYWGNGINKGSNDIFLPAGSLRFFGRDAGFESWQNNFIISYVKLKPGIAATALEAPVKQLLATNTGADVQKNLKVVLTPVKDYYLQSNNGIAYRMIYALGLVALFILLMAIINFINISVGNSVTRLREIGVRKVMGGSKKQLIFQYMAESMLMVAFSTLVALLLYVLIRPYFSEIVGKQIPAITAFPVYFIAIPLLVIVLVGIIAGFYPAFVLARQNAIASLKGKLETVKEKVAFRYSLITIQFVTGIVVFICALVIQQQVQYFFNTDLGYKKDKVITAKVPRDWSPAGVQKMETMRNEFERLPQVAAVSFSFEIPDGASSNNNIRVYKALQDSSQAVIAESLFTDEKYLATYNIPLLKGKFFNAAGGTVAPDEIVVNESIVSGLGWKNPSEAINQKIKFQGNPQLFTITGVVKDFHFSSLHDKIRPVYFVHVNNLPLYRYFSFRLKDCNTQAAIAALQTTWSKLLPDAPFDYSFMDDTLARLYSTEMQMKKASGAATIIALLIVLLGVFGIVTQSITRRTKEVGIRKVLGASVMQVVMLFGKEFSKLVVIANIIAWPLAYMAVNKWLNNYAYRITINALPFVAVSVLLLLLVAMVIILKTIKTAIANPVSSIKTE